MWKIVQRIYVDGGTCNLGGQYSRGKLVSGSLSDDENISWITERFRGIYHGYI
jgi:hypothetical protein